VSFDGDIVGGHQEPDFLKMGLHQRNRTISGPMQDLRCPRTLRIGADHKGINWKEGVAFSSLEEAAPDTARRRTAATTFII